MPEKNSTKNENRLAKESSPYLKQHSKNPVDWYPWGEEAFEKAAKEDKPIFLSIGYSSCHWCHVMERESFEDGQVARVLNKYFVSIKVDREERPDIDSTYLAAAQLISGQGGWPLTIVMTPDKKPFFAATYLPKEGKQGMPGLLNLLPTLAEYWKERRGEIETSASRLTLALRSIKMDSSGDGLGPLVLDDAFQRLIESFDEHWAGFGTAPKFPIPHRLTFLLRYWYRTNAPMALFIVDRTLEAMRHGGIFDQLGYGFHRYSTDRKWILPHFEKMLYDQALMIVAYIEGYQATGKAEFALTAKETIDYVLRDLAAPNGAFYSSEDADSEGEEGKFYLWTKDEIDSILNAEERRTIEDDFSIEKSGNYVEGLLAEKTGKNVLHRVRDFHDPLPDASDQKIIESAARKLLEVRRRRARPSRDDKILVDWNGLMISALSIACRVLQDSKYKEAATSCADLILERAMDENGRVSHLLSKEGSAGFLSDHAFLALGLIDLYESTFDAKYLENALKICESMLARFWDDEQGGFFETAADSETILIRRKEAYDGALPSGNSISLLVLYKLYLITEREDLLTRATKTEIAFSKMISETPQNFTQFLIGVDLILGPTFEIAFVGPCDEIRRMAGATEQRFIPRKVLVGRPSDRLTNIESLSPLLEARDVVNGKATAYVCADKTCKEPVTNDDDLLKALGAR